MGVFRFFLAFLVAFSHAPQTYLPLNLGASAVIGFYFISGYLMTWQYKKFQTETTSPLKAFYIDRFIRIYPLFFIVFVATGLLFLISSKLGGFLSPKTFLELFIIPQPYMQYMGGTTGVIPQAWSLGIELQFYLLLPFLFLLRLRTRIAILVFLMALQFIFFHIDRSLDMITTGLSHIGYPGLASITGGFCSFKLGFLSMPCGNIISDLLGYRWLPCVFLYFLLGNICFETKNSKLRPEIFFLAANVAMVVILSDTGAFSNSMVGEVLWGALIFIPVGLFLARHIDMFSKNGIDKFLGQLAYPLFLVHYLARWIVEETGVAYMQVTFMFIIAIALSIVLAKAQSKIDAYRYKIRGFGRATSKL